MRKSVIITVTEFTNLDCGIGVHFGFPNKLSGDALWFPLSQTKSVLDVDFKEIERLMVMNRIAINVTSITRKQQYSSGCEYEVVYNEVEEVC